jgi:hypothetical protein
MIQVQADGTHIITRESDGRTLTIGPEVAYADRDAQIAGFMGPQSLPVPESISPRQARLALYGAGLLDAATAAAHQAGPVAKIYWEYAIEWRRDDAILKSLAVGLGLSELQLDELFRQASQL